MASQAKLSRIAIDKILLATDFSPMAENALRFASAFAKRYQCELTVMHVLTREFVSGVGDTWPEVTEMLEEQAETSMAKLEKTTELYRLPHDTSIAKGSAVDVILQTTLDKRIDLIVMGTHGYAGARKLFLGSTAENVIRHAVCPVLTVGPHVGLAGERFHHIFYATDFSSGSSRALNYALSVAEEDRAKFTLLHVIEGLPVSEPELMEWRQQDLQQLNRMLPGDADLACKPEVEVERGTPHVEILRVAEARKADLIVMGSHSGGTFSTHLPWTTLHHVLEHAPCPVLTVRER